MKFVCEKANVEFPNKDGEPYKSLKHLKILRDFSAHGKTEVREKIVQAKSGEELPRVESKLNELVSAEVAERILPVLEAYVVELNTKIRGNLYLERLDEYPLQGFLGHSSASEIAS